MNIYHLRARSPDVTKNFSSNQSGAIQRGQTAQLRGGLCMTGWKRLLTLQTTGAANLQLHAFSTQRGERLQQEVRKNVKASTRIHRAQHRDAR